MKLALLDLKQILPLVLFWDSLIHFILLCLSIHLTMIIFYSKRNFLYLKHSQFWIPSYSYQISYSLSAISHYFFVLQFAQFYEIMRYVFFTLYHFMLCFFQANVKIEKLLLFSYFYFLLKQKDLNLAFRESLFKFIQILDHILVWRIDHKILCFYMAQYLMIFVN